MWSPIPRTPTSCALSTWWLPNLFRHTCAGPSGDRRFLLPAPAGPQARILSCGGQKPAAILNGGTLPCAVAIVRIAAAAVAGAAAAAAPAPGTTAGPSPCPLSTSCPCAPAAAALPPAGRSTSPSPPSCGRTRRRTPAPAAAAAAGADPRAAPQGAVTYPHSHPRGPCRGGFFCPCFPCAPRCCVSNSFFRQKKLLTNGRRLIKYA